MSELRRLSVRAAWLSLEARRERRWILNMARANTPESTIAEHRARLEQLEAAIADVGEMIRRIKGR